LSGLDASVLMSLEEKIATWANQSDADIVKAIVAGYGVTIKADTTQTVHNADNTTIVQRGTDIQFVQALAQRNGFEFFFEPDAGGGSVTAYFRTPLLSGAPQSDLAVQFGGSSNLRSFVARLAGQRPLNVKATQMDIQSNSPVRASASQTQLTTLGQRDLNSLVGGPLGSLVTPSDAQAAMLILGSPTSDQTELQVLTQAVRDEAGWFIEASGEINSDAYGAVLRPRRLVLVKGAGTQYSGTYYVTRVVHEVRADGSYIQKFQARRNARDLSGAEQFGSSS
jgi:phage protein D